MTARAPSRLDAYLAWQSEIGTAEVVMPSPWAKPGRAAGPASTPKTPNDPAGHEEDPAPSFPRSARESSAPSPTSASPGDFFRDIEKRLSEPARKPAAPKPAAPSSSPASPAASLVPDFASLEDYWNWLADEYPRWFPGVSQALARAEGRPGARVAVVEMFPAGGALFGDDDGALLDKMMQAIGLSRDALYLTSVMKTPPVGKAWARKDVARALPSFLAELKLANCGAVLLLGEACAQAVLRTGKSLAALEALDAAIPEVGDVALAAVWHPADLLRDRALKAPTWERLQALSAALKSLMGRPEGNKA